MDILIHVEAAKPDKDFKNAMDEYIKRMSPFARVKPIFHKDIKKASTKEGSYVINVAPSKNMLSSPKLAERLNDICVNGFSRIEFVISDAPLDIDAMFTFGVSYMQLDAELTATALTEQLYRAFTILNNITYHK